MKFGNGNACAALSFSATAEPVGIKGAENLVRF